MEALSLTNSVFIVLFKGHNLVVLILNETTAVGATGNWLTSQT